MEIDLTLDNFLDTLLGDVVKKVNGVDEIVPEREKISLGICFGESLNLKVYPAAFEANINKETIKIDPPNGDWLTYKHTLNDKQILHFIVLYRLCYLKAHYPDKFDTIQDIPSSKNMNEYFSKSKEELQDEYNKVKVDVGAN